MAKPRKRIEMIEEYLMPNDEHSDYQYNDNHGVLVRCKDCLYFDDMTDIGKGMICSYHSVADNNGDYEHYFYTAAEGYCAWAERRDDE